MTDFYTYTKQYGNVVLHRGYRQGKSVTEKIEFKPSFFVQSKKKNPEWKSLYGEPLDRVHFSSINEAKDFRKKYEGVEGFEVHGMERFEYQYIAENYPDEITVTADKTRILFIDLEVVGEEDSGFPDVESANLPIVLISVHDRNSNKTTVFGTRAYDKKSEFEYRRFKSEADLLKGLLDYWECGYPDIVSGWNTEGFDEPYLLNRMVKVLGMDQAKRLSPFRILRETQIEVNNKKIKSFDVFGVTFLDYMALYKKFGSQSQKESYSLSAIAQEELGEDKIESPVSSFYEFYNSYHDTFVEYNAHDSVLVHKIDNNLKLFDLVLTITYMLKCNISDALGTIRGWDCLVYNTLHKRNVAIPPSKHAGSVEFPGAWVKDTIVGYHNWVMSFDFGSLYPSIIRQWNMSPETITDLRLDVTPDHIVDETLNQNLEALVAKNNNYSIAANGTTYRTEVKGIIPEMMEMLVVGRKTVKKEMLRVEQEYQNTKDEIAKRKLKMKLNPDILCERSVNV